MIVVINYKEYMMKTINKLLILVGCILLVACSTQKPMDVFPGINKLQHLWQNENGDYFTAIQYVDGKFTLHQPKTGRSYYYFIKNNQQVSRPVHSPSLSYIKGRLIFGDEVLKPAETKNIEITFSSHNTQFYGILTVPISDHPVPVVINSHGSERSVATAFEKSSSWYIDAGFATFTFDKRGTGSSGGEYTHNFDIMADDLVAAINTISKRSEIDPNKLGVAGFSQGVYVSTLAASRTNKIKFAIESFGMTESPIIEDLHITEIMFNKAYPKESWEEFEPFVKACQNAFALEKNDEWSIVVELKKDWVNKINPEFLSGSLVGDGCLSWGPTLLKWVGRNHFPPGIIWDYDPIPSMESLNIPVIWQFGGKDITAPNENTRKQIKHWIEQEKPFTMYLYPEAAHGILISAVDKFGETYRYKDPQYITDLIAWLKKLK